MSTKKYSLCPTTGKMFVATTNCNTGNGGAQDKNNIEARTNRHADNT